MNGTKFDIYTYINYIYTLNYKNSAFQIIIYRIYILLLYFHQKGVDS